MDWLQYIVQGGSLVLLTVVLFGVWRIITELVHMLRDQAGFIREATAVQQQLCSNLEHHEQNALERHKQLIGQLRDRA